MFPIVLTTSIVTEKPAKHLEHLQINTLGPYSKWEHKYSFSKNGDTATDLSKKKKTYIRNI